MELTADQTLQKKKSVNLKAGQQKLSKQKHREKKKAKRNGQTRGTTLSSLLYEYFDFQEERREKRVQNNSRNNGIKISKYNKIYKDINPRNSKISSRINTKVHGNQVAENQ